MNVRLHPEAERELRQAVEYYEDAQRGFGHEFASEVTQTFGRIAGFPYAWSMIDPDIRRAIVNRFPYAVIYAIRGNTIFVLAIAHFRRKPGYWKERSTNL